MEPLKFDLTKKLGKFKILNATNGGPLHKRHAFGQYRSNFEDYKAARIPYSRNHDSAAHSIYGGPYSHDITSIFPNFDADVNDPASYDFACTDEAIFVCLEAGTETFFRLGQTIEHQIKKHGTIPPKDFNKWAEICEHIIMHYNEGWADGFDLGIKYWEIWNEPDLYDDNSPSKSTWGGTKAQFFDFYEIAAKRLKARFPHLMIGGPALAWRVDWAKDFLYEMKNRNVPIDFFSWHICCTEPQKMLDRADALKSLLIENGYEDAENILNEWNYIEGWDDEFVYSLKAIHGIKGAAFTMACISAAQKSPIDMLMYYDTMPHPFNGAFDYYTYEKLKGYYPLAWYGNFYDMEAEVRCESEHSPCIYTLCGVDKDGKALCIVTNYSNDDEAESREVKIDFGEKGKYEIYMLDDEHDAELISTTSDLKFTLKNHSCAMIKQI